MNVTDQSEGVSGQNPASFDPQVGSFYSMGECHATGVGD